LVALVVKIQEMIQVVGGKLKDVVTSDGEKKPPSKGVVSTEGSWRDLSSHDDWLGVGAPRGERERKINVIRRGSETGYGKM